MNTIRLGSIVAVLALAGLAGGQPAGSAVRTHVAAPMVSSACGAGSVRAMIGGHVKCLHAGAHCSTRFNKSYRKHGFTCTGGRLHRIKATTPPPPPVTTPTPPPPPPPPAEPGHYKGESTMDSDFEFDVTSDGAGVTNLITGEINEDCVIEGLNVRVAGLTSLGIESGSTIVPIAADSTFKIDAMFQSQLPTDSGTVTTNEHVVITGHFSGASASGTFIQTTTFTLQGVPYSCSSDPQTWTVTKTS